MIFIPILFVGLRDDPSKSHLPPSLKQHESVLLSRPFLKGRKSEPIGSGVLVLGVDWVTCCQVVVWIQTLDHFPGLMCPKIAAILIEIISKIPSDIGKRSEARDGVLQESLLVFAPCFRMGSAVVHIKNERDHHVAISCET